VGDEQPSGAAAGRVAAFFDLDKTIIATTSSAAFSRPFYEGGLISRRDVVRGTIAQALYVLGRADAEQTERLRRHLSAMVTGWDVEQMSRIVNETVHEYVRPTVYAEALALIDEHRAAGHDVVVVSASGEEIVRPIAAMLGADHVVATRLEVVDGRYTGEIAYYAYGPEKAAAVRALADERGYDLEACHAYSDSVTDVPMLEQVGKAAVVNPDRTLRRIAVERGWDVLTFRRPVTLRPQLPPPRRTVPVLAAVAVGTALGIALARRRRAA